MAFGHIAQARGIDSIATGTRAEASGLRSMATGLEANASATDSTATGTRAKASGVRSQALGYEAKSYAANGVALGSNSVSGIVDTETDPTLKAFNKDTIAIGNSAQATFQDATATGTRAQATALSAMASGTDAEATAENASASGKDALASAKNAIASGTGAQAKAESAIALGTKAGDAGTGVNSISTGNNASAQGISSIASGTNARAYKEGSIAIGRGAQAGQGIAQGGNKAVALGDGSGAFANNSVALGAGSKTNNSYTSSTAAYSNITNNDATSGVVSVGDGGAERRILNVAGGQADTDGVNIAQLKAVDKLLTERGMNFSAESGADVHRDLGETLAIEGADSNITTSTEPGKINIELAKNLDLGPDGSVKMGNTLVNNSGLTITDGPSITTGGINAGGKVISNVAAGVDGKDAVNVDQLEGVKTTAEKGWNLQTNDKASSTTQVKPGETVNFDQGQNIEITQDGLNVTVATAQDVKFENVQITEEITIAGNTTINEGGITTNNVTSEEIIVNHNGDTINVGETLDKGITFVGDDGEKTEQKLGSELVVAGDENINTTVEDGKVQVNLDKNLTGLDSVETGTINVGGGTFVAGDNKVTVGAGTTIDMGNNQITNVAAGTGDDHAVNLGQLKKVDETANKGWNLLTNNDHDSLTQVKPGDDVDFQSGDNIEITQDGLNVTVATAKDVKFENVESTTVNVTEELTVANNTTINEGGITSNNLTVSGETKLGDYFHVTNEGDVNYNVEPDQIKNDYQVVNKKYVDKASDDLTNLGMDFAGNRGDVHKNLGETLIIRGGMTDTTGPAASAQNLRTVVNKDGEMIVQMSRNLIDLDSIAINNGGPIINTDGINMGGNQITNVGAGTEVDHAVNLGQLEEGLAAAKTEVKAGKNIVVTTESEDPSVYIVKTEDDVAFDSVTSEDDDGNKTVLNPEGVTISGPDETVPATQLGSTQIKVGGSNPIEMNGNTGMITGLTNRNWSSPSFADGSGRAATEEQLKPLGDFLGFEGGEYTFNYNGKDHKDLASALNSIHWNVEAPAAGDNTGGTGNDTGGGSTGGNGSGSGESNKTPIHNSNTVGFVGDGNITVSKTEREDKDGANIHVNLNPDIAVDSVTINNGGPVINQGGINMGGNNITNLAPGVDGSDAVNVDQLDKVKETANKGWNVSTQGGTATQVKPGDTVDFANKDGNIVVANNGTNVTVDLAKDIAVDNVQVDNSVTVGGNTNNQTVIKEGNVTTNEVIIKRPGNPDWDMNVGETLNKGITFVGTEGQTERKLGETLEIVGANENITTKVNGPKGILEIALSNDLALDSVTINNGGPIINENGINMVDKRITNVAAGIDETDAVNVGQLGRVQDNLQGQVNHLRHDVRRLDKKLSAGVAAAMATAGLPQAYLPGKSMMAMSGGTWNGESGMAIGFSTITDNGKWVIKAAGNATGRGDYGGTVGVGYQW